MYKISFEKREDSWWSKSDIKDVIQKIFENLYKKEDKVFDIKINRKSIILNLNEELRITSFISSLQKENIIQELERIDIFDNSNNNSFVYKNGKFEKTA